MPPMIKTEENHKSIDWSTSRSDESDKRPTWKIALQGRESMYRRMIRRRVGKHAISLTCGMRAPSSHERQRATENTHKEHVILKVNIDEAGIARNEHIS